jgi:hypothetical protein
MNNRYTRFVSLRFRTPGDDIRQGEKRYNQIFDHQSSLRRHATASAGSVLPPVHVASKFRIAGFEKSYLTEIKRPRVSFC